MFDLKGYTTVCVIHLRKKNANIVNQDQKALLTETGPRSAVGNVSSNRCESDCRSSGREVDPGLVPYFPGD